MSNARAGLERWLERERDQLPLWLPVALGAGVAAWFLLPGPAQWIGMMMAGVAVALIGLMLSDGGRFGRMLLIGGVALALGCGLAWWRAERVAAPVLARPGVVSMTGRVESVEPLAARGVVRVRLAVETPKGMPPVVRVNIREQDVPAGLSRGAYLRLRGWMMPPPQPGVPGAYDFARTAWFHGIGATGRAFAPVTVLQAGDPPGSNLRMRLSRHIQARIGGGAGAIAATLATGDRGALSDSDADAMRRSGLAHLLSISGLHVTAVVGATMLLVLRLLALFPGLALRVRLPLVAAGAGALTAIGYTLLTGAQVPTVRACVAALLVLAAMAMGREAITLRLVAAAALFVLLVWPETLAGPSFQLSFAAVTAIVALHEHPRVRGWFARREEGWGRRIGRGLLSLFLTGLVVEIALMPIALYHFHKAGLYGAAANIVAIPLTTFVIMPFEALALLFDAVGLGAPFWWIVDEALRFLLALAHATATAPGAVALLPGMPKAAFALILLGGLWIALWRSRMRWVGLVPVAAGVFWAVITPAPDLIVGGEGTHLALRTADGTMALLRDRSGEYTRSMMGEAAGSDADPAALDEQPGARCSHDFCMADIRRGGRVWRISATRSDYLLPYAQLVSACRVSDIVVSDRRLPKGCVPRWLKLDPVTLAKTGGVAINLTSGKVRRVHAAHDRHPWVYPPITRPVKARGGAARHPRHPSQ
ncbi:ComEC/Rec2 family competence protein [Stakelama sediminis]